jgi:hypothetical protein
MTLGLIWSGLLGHDLMMMKGLCMLLQNVQPTNSPDLLIQTQNSCILPLMFKLSHTGTIVTWHLAYLRTARPASGNTQPCMQITVSAQDG